MQVLAASCEPVYAMTGKYALLLKLTLCKDAYMITSFWDLGFGFIFCP